MLDFHTAPRGVDWESSPRRFEYVVERGVSIPLADGVLLDADIWRPVTPEPSPAILGFHCYEKSGQTGPIKPAPLSTGRWRNPGQERSNASLEAGDPTFFARRGYLHVVCNARGSGASEGEWQFLGGPQIALDAAEVVEWIARQEWCDGNVGMFGVSYFAEMGLFAAALDPPHLRAVFCPWAQTDPYRDSTYRGGIFSGQWRVEWTRTSLVYGNCRPENYSKRELGEAAYNDAIQRVLEDEDIRANRDLLKVLRAPEADRNMLIVDLLLHPTYDEFWAVRSLDTTKIRVPVYLGADWGSYGLHLPAAFRNWENVAVPKRLLVGPPCYLDRPLYQVHFEALRWFDHWLRDLDTGMMEEPPIRLFVMNRNEWLETSDWPLEQTRFTPFYLHQEGLLSGEEPLSSEGSDSFEDSPWGRGRLEYVTPPMGDDVEIVGPIAVRLYAATTGSDINWVVSLLWEDRSGRRVLLTKGWLKGSHRALDHERSKPWEPLHLHSEPAQLTPGEICEFDIKVMPTGAVVPAQTRIVLRISSVDEEPANAVQLTGIGSLPRSEPSRVTIFRNGRYPSHVLLPVTGGNW